ncbi:MAG: aldehyde dehydrogenase family protein [Elstera sp.]
MTGSPPSLLSAPDGALAAALARVPTNPVQLVAGRFVTETSLPRLTRQSPAHGVTVAEYPQADRALVEEAIAAARAAFDTGPWPKMTGADRARLLHRVADLIERDAEILATLDCLEVGKPLTQARAEIAGAADIWRYAAGLARDLHGESYATLGANKLGVVLRDPIGVVTMITPWNFPLLIVSQKLPFALAAGCTALVKPSEVTPGSTLHLGRLLMEAGLPAGVANILVGTGPEVGAPLAEDGRVDMISFTGSTKVGKQLMAVAGRDLKKVSMELGGKNPQILFPDGDRTAALDAILFGGFFNAGECCNAGSRLIVHRAIAAEVLGELAARAASLPVGDPLHPDTRVGAIITADHLHKIAAAVGEAQAGGARVLVGGGAISAGPDQLYFAPTLLADVRADMAAAREEIFGPVLSVLTFETVEEAIALANGTAYGLSAGVWSRDFDTCLTVGRGVRAGTVWMNTFMDGAAELPFGGYRASGLGRELGRRAVEDYTEEKTLHLHTGPRTGWWLPRA